MTLSTMQYPISSRNKVFRALTRDGIAREKKTGLVSIDEYGTLSRTSNLPFNVHQKHCSLFTLPNLWDNFCSNCFFFKLQCVERFNAFSLTLWTGMSDINDKKRWWVVKTVIYASPVIGLTFCWIPSFVDSTLKSVQLTASTLFVSCFPIVTLAQSAPNQIRVWNDKQQHYWFENSKTFVRDVKGKNRQKINDFPTWFLVVKTH